MTRPRFVLHASEATDADAVYAGTLSSLMEVDTALTVHDGDSHSVGAGKSFNEILNFGVVVTSPRQRLLWNSARRLNLPAAVARFVWMMAGSDRLADIAFYEPKVRFFSDDGVSVPGSNYGQRMLQPRPGLNQLVAVIARLKENRHSRRAAISIYHPEDAVRASRDIPCAFGLFYHIRADALHATTLMRSNNAYILLPYNIFEFSLLAEVVAAELKVDLGTLTHSAASMHLFQENVEASQEVLGAEAELNRSELPVLPAVPDDDSPVEQVRTLVQLEAELRHMSAALGEQNIESLIQKGEEKLNSYWRQLYYLLGVHVARQNESAGALERLQSVLTSPWLEYLPTDTFETQAPTPEEQKELRALELSHDARPVRVVPLHASETHRALRSHAATWERNTGSVLRWDEFVELEERFGKRLAARGDATVAFEEFEAALRDIQSRPSDRADQGGPRV